MRMFYEISCLQSSAVCPDGWDHMPVTDSCYKYIDEEMTFDAANQRCKTEGESTALLAMPKTEAENNFLIDLRNRFGG